MNIYTAKPITDKIVESFIPARLYIKEINGIKYFGKTSKEDIFKYVGSGKLWLKHVNKYGKENVKTPWVSDWFYDPQHIQQFALMFSELNQIVESEEWANLMPEDGLSGGAVINNNFRTWNKKPKLANFKEHLSKLFAGKRTVHKPVQIEENYFEAMRDAAKFYKVSEQTIYRWVKIGKAIKL
jgi:hypothetical protein